MPEDTFRGDDNGYACMTVEGGGRGVHGPRQDDAGGPLQTPVVEEVKPEKTERARDGGPQRREGEAQTKWAGGRKAVGHGCATLRPPASGIWGTAFSGGRGQGRGGTGRGCFCPRGSPGVSSAGVLPWSSISNAAAHSSSRCTAQSAVPTLCRE